MKTTVFATVSLIISLFLLGNFVYHRIPFTKKVIEVSVCSKNYSVMFEEADNIRYELTDTGKVRKYYYDNCKVEAYDIDSFGVWKDGWLSIGLNYYEEDKVSFEIKDVTYYK